MYFLIHPSPSDGQVVLICLLHCLEYGAPNLGTLILDHLPDINNPRLLLPGSDWLTGWARKYWESVEKRTAVRNVKSASLLAVITFAMIKDYSIDILEHLLRLGRFCPKVH